MHVFQAFCVHRAAHGPTTPPQGQHPWAPHRASGPGKWKGRTPGPPRKELFLHKTDDSRATRGNPYGKANCSSRKRTSRVRDELLGLSRLETRAVPVLLGLCGSHTS